MQVVLLFTVRLSRLQVPAPQLMQLVELCLGTSGLVRPYWKSCGGERFLSHCGCGQAVFTNDWGIASRDDLMDSREPADPSPSPPRPSSSPTTDGTALAGPLSPSKLAPGEPSEARGGAMGAGGSHAAQALLALQEQPPPRAQRRAGNSHMRAACGAELIDFVLSRLTLQRQAESSTGHGRKGAQTHRRSDAQCELGRFHCEHCGVNALTRLYCSRAQRLGRKPAHRPGS